MDWVRAKTILIGIFIILNIFLVYNIYVKESKAVVISGKEISDISMILKNNNIDLKATIPTKVLPKSFLKIEDISYKEDDVVKKLLGDTKTTSKVINNDISIYKSGNKSVEFYKDKTIYYKDNEPTENIDISSKNKAEKYVLKFLKTKGINLNYGVLNNYIQSQDGCEISFKQEFKGNAIYVSYMSAKLSNKGIAEFKMRWVNPIDFIDAPKDIKTPIEMLLIFSKDIGEDSNISVNNISLGYYFDLEEIKNATVSAFPVWKIQTVDNEYYYNAYEGYLENKNN